MVLAPWGKDARILLLALWSVGRGVSLHSEPDVQQI